MTPQEIVDAVVLGMPVTVDREQYYDYGRLVLYGWRNHLLDSHDGDGAAACQREIERLDGEFEVTDDSWGLT